MQNFYSERKNFIANKVTIVGKEHHHATRSCRVKPGEVIGITDGCGRRVAARIESIESDNLTAVIERDISGIGEPVTDIIMALSLIKPSRFELALEKCTELGAGQFIPLLTERCGYKPECLRSERLLRIVFEAAKQSGRSRVPSINSPVDLKELFGKKEPADVKGKPVFVAVRLAEKSLEDALSSFMGVKALTLVIGPEGDFTDIELEYMKSIGAIPFSLGGLTLRSETAAIIATALSVSAVKRV